MTSTGTRWATSGVPGCTLCHFLNECSQYTLLGKESAYGTAYPKQRDRFLQSKDKRQLLTAMVHPGLGFIPCTGSLQGPTKGAKTLKVAYNTQH